MSSKNDAHIAPHNMAKVVARERMEILGFCYLRRQAEKLIFATFFRGVVVGLVGWELVSWFGVLSSRCLFVHGMRVVFVLDIGCIGLRLVTRVV